jgi:hypothetical protein
VVKVYNLFRVKTDRSVVLTVKCGLDAHMISEIEDEIEIMVLYGFEIL